jgi:hypothetical protein
MTHFLVIASEAKQFRKQQERTDCFVAEPVLGRREAPIRVLLAMTFQFVQPYPRASQAQARMTHSLPPNS